MLTNITDVGDRSFEFGVATQETGATLSCRCDGNAIRLVAHRVAVVDWAAGEAAGIYFEQTSLNGKVLTLALEKDFRCLDPRRDEDESDHFANPLSDEVHSTASARAVE